MTALEVDRTAHLTYSRLVAHFLRHLEATTSLTLGGRLSKAPHDPAATTAERAVRDGSVARGALMTASLLPPSALRASVALDEPFRTPSAPGPTQPREVTPVRADAGAHYWLDTSIQVAILARDSAGVGVTSRGDTETCNARATVRANRPTSAAAFRGAVCPSDAVNAADGQSPHRGPVHTLTPSSRPYPMAFRGLRDAEVTP